MRSINKRPRLLISTVCLCLFYFEMQAQDEQINYTVQADRNQQQFQYFDINQFEQKNLFKIAVNTNFILERHFDFPKTILGYERKLLPWLSTDLYFSIFPSESKSGFGAGFRVYPTKMVQNPAKLDQVNHFSGSYLGIGFDREFETSRLSEFLPGVNSLMISAGYQYRIGNLAYVDLAAQLRHRDEQVRESVTIEAKAIGGLALGSSKTQVLRSDNLDLVSESRVQIALKNPYLALNIVNDEAGAAFSSEIRLINEFTLLTELEYNYFKFDFDIINPEPVYNNIRTTMELRNYFGKEARMKKGKPVASFAGYYAAARFSYLSLRQNYVSEVISYSEYELRFREEGFSSQLAIGWQQSFGKFLFDLNYGAGINISSGKFLHNFTSKVGFVFLRA